MKTAFVLAATANLLAFAYAADDNGFKKAKSSGDMSTFENDKVNVLISKTSDAGDMNAEMYCGGYSYEGCSNACYWEGYLCYMCTSSYCECNNYSC